MEIQLQIRVSSEAFILMKNFTKIEEIMCKTKEVYDLLTLQTHNCVVCDGTFSRDLHRISRVFFMVHGCFYSGSTPNIGTLARNMPPKTEWLGKRCLACVCPEDDTTLGTMDDDEDIVCFPRCGHVIHEDCAFENFFPDIDPETATDVEIRSVFTHSPKCPICNIDWFLRPRPIVQV